MTQAASKVKFETQSADETYDFGKCLAGKLKTGDIICFYGDLGAGKTTMIKGIAKGLKIKSDYVHSPTFTLLNIYEHGKIPFFHFDLYRIESIEEIFGIGYEEFLYGRGVSVIEWAEKFGKLLPGERIEIHVKHRGQEKREVKIKAVGEKYKNRSWDMDIRKSENRR